MGIFDIFKSSSKAVDTAANIAEKTADGIGKIFFTEEEKSDARQKWFTVWLDLQKTLSTEGTPTAISRRILAFMVMGPFVGLIIFGVIVFKFDPTWAKFILTEGVERLALLAAAVGATYFIKDAVVKAIQANK